MMKKIIVLIGLCFYSIVMVGCQLSSAKQDQSPTRIIFEDEEFFTTGYSRTDHFDEMLEGTLVIQSIYFDEGRGSNAISFDVTIRLKNVSGRSIFIRKPCSKGIFLSNKDSVRSPSNPDLTFFIGSITGEKFSLHYPFSHSRTCFNEEDFILLEPNEEHITNIQNMEYFNADRISDGEYYMVVYYRNAIVGYKDSVEDYYIDLDAWVGVVESNKVNFIIP